MRYLAGGMAAGAAAVVMGVVGAVLAFSRMAEEPASREVYDPSLYGFTGPRGCVLPSTPPYFRAMAMPARSRAEAESLAWRLGLPGRWEQDLYACELQGGGALVWVTGPRMAREVRIPGPRIAPLVHRVYEPQDPVLPMGLYPLRRPEPRYPAPGQPGVFQTPIALVASVDRVVRTWPPAKSEGDDVPLLPFGEWIELPELGARARRGSAGGWSSSVLVMEPTNSSGWAARWLEETGPGWIGFELPHVDLATLRRGFDERGVRVREFRDGALWLPPSEGGGALVVFPSGPGL